MFSEEAFLRPARLCTPVFIGDNRRRAVYLIVFRVHAREGVGVGVGVGLDVLRRLMECPHFLLQLGTVLPSP